MPGEFEKNDRSDLFSKSVRAGRRTYFFDVKSTKGNDQYLTITESKKRFTTDGKFIFEKHKIFLYREDFEKFVEGLNTAINYIAENAPPMVTNYSRNEQGDDHKNSDLNFEDLGN